MANYNTSANIVLSVNGKQAQKMLSQLQGDAKRLEAGIARAASAGDKATMTKLRSELNSTRKMMEQLKGTSSTVENTLLRLDKATPRELNKALTTLRRQLGSIERGTAAWDAHVAKIRSVKQEIQRVNETMNAGTSRFDRFKAAIGGWGTSLLGGIASLTGMVAVGKSAVEAYASMEQEMASVRKYTGMSADEVQLLNDEFKKIDTRSSREELNRLAQEAGRLGKSSVDDVLGFVRAADKINVALDDLGDGATLTLSKLTGIFGVEQKLGTERSLLAVGSVINELSQNCSASAPYIAEFTSRMGGVGAQAGMTAQQIMAFAAVLDANNQGLESSSTALQQVIVRLYKEPAKYAKVAGLDAAKFTALVRKDMNAALIELLSTLQKAGGMDKLSPMFADMGENGSRSIATLAALAGHIDEVRQQQIVANEAFEQATSIDEEFAVQNGTVQASLEKARNRIRELTVELGQKLQPVMTLVINSTTVAIKVISAFVDFLAKHKAAVIACTAALVLYKVQVLLYNSYTSVAAAKTALLNLATTKFPRIAALARVAMAGLTNAVQYFTNGMQVNYAMQQRWQGAISKLKAIKIGNIFALAITGAVAAAAAFIALMKHLEKLHNQGKKTQYTIEQFGQAMKTISEDAAKAASEEITKLDALYKAATNEASAKQERIKAAQSLINLYPEQFKNMSAETIMLGNAITQYQRLRDSILQVAEAKAAAKYVQQKYEEIVALRMQCRPIEEQRAAAAQEYNEATEADRQNAARQRASRNAAAGSAGLQRSATAQFSATANTTQTEEQRIAARVAQSRLRLGDLTSQQNAITYQINALFREIEYISSRYGNQKGFKETFTGTPTETEPEGGSNSSTPYGSDADRKRAEKERKAQEAAARRAATKAKKEFKQELDDAKGDWEEEQAALAVDYSAGLMQWTEYLRRKHEAEMKYFDEREKIYKKWNLTEDEDYKALQLKRAEAEAEWKQRNAALTVKQAERAQRVDETNARMDYATSGTDLYLNEEALQQQLFDIRITALKKMQAAYEKTTEEYHNYEEKIQEAEAAEQLRRQEVYAKKIEEWRKNYEYLQAGDRLRMELALLEQAYAKKLISEEEYQRALQDIKKKYATDYLPESAKPSTSGVSAQAGQQAQDFERIDRLEKDGVLTHEQAEKAKERISRSYSQKMIENARKFGSEQTNMLLDIYQAWENFFNATEEDGSNWATRLAALASAAFAPIAASMQSASEFIKLEADIQTAKIEKKYDREIELAEGNTYRVKRAEKKKEQELAKIKSEASRKQYAMQVIQAVAQTAINALNAYGSAAAVPVVGHILAPIAAAMATASGMVQVALLKKQQQAADAQGYSEGGFTPDGGKYEPAGIVHAGEWVASQRLTPNPRIRPLLEALDYAQRTNTIGSITAADVSRTITAPAIIAASTPPPALVATAHSAPGNERVESTLSTLDATISTLRDRLNEPFVTVNTVTGDHGMQQAQDEYARLMSNKSPKKFKK